MKYYYSLFILLILISSCENLNERETIKPSDLNITEFVYASVNVVPKNTYYSRPNKSGIIKEVFITKGDKIKKGQALFSIDVTADAINRLNNASVNLKEAQDNFTGINNKLTGIENELQIIKNQNNTDSINYQRNQRLWEKSIGSKNNLEQSLLKYQSSSSKLKALKIQYQQTKSSLENQYKKAQNSVDTERSLLDDLVVKSKIDGKAFTIFKEVGEFISPQENFAEIANTDNFIIEMNIDEVDISKITIGDTALIHLEAYPDSVYLSTLVYISEVKDELTQTFKIEGIFEEPPSKLFSGLAGEANILIERRNNAMVIPSEYLVNGNEVLTEGGPTEVTVGFKSIEHIEILAGIDSTTVLLKPEF